MRILAKTNVAFTDVVWVFDSAGAGVTGLVNAGFTSKVTIKDGARVATPTFTLTEVDSTNAPGAYVVAFTPDADAAWQLRFKHATYNVRGWTVNLTSYARGLDDHAYPATSGRSLAVSAAGEVDANVAKWLTATPNALQSGRVDSYVGAILAGVIAAASFASGALDAVWSTGTRALTDKAGFALSSAGVQAIWDALTSALTTVGSVGKRIADNLDALISTRLPTSSYTAPPSAATVAAATWDEALAGHSTAGTAGKKLSDLSTSAPPSAATIAAAVADEALAGHTTAGTVGEALSALRQGVLSTGTAQGGTTTAIQLAAGETAQAEAYYGAILTIVSGTGAPQTRSLGYYNSSTKTATVTYPFATAPDNTSVYRIEAGPTEVLGVAIVGPGAIDASSLAADTINASKIAANSIGASELAADAASEIATAVAAALSIPSAAAIADAVHDEDLSGHATAGTAGAALGRVDATVSSRATDAGAGTDAASKVLATPSQKLVTDAGGRVTVGAILADAIAAAAIATDARQALADALLDRASAVDGETPRAILRGLAASLLGEDVGTLTAPELKAIDGSKTRVSGTITAGVRNSATLDLT